MSATSFVPFAVASCVNALEMFDHVPAKFRVRVIRRPGCYGCRSPTTLPVLEPGRERPRNEKLLNESAVVQFSADITRPVGRSQRLPPSAWEIEKRPRFGLSTILF